MRLGTADSVAPLYHRSPRSGLLGALRGRFSRGLGRSGPFGVPLDEQPLVSDRRGLITLTRSRSSSGGHPISIVVADDTEFVVIPTIASSPPFTRRGLYGRVRTGNALAFGTDNPLDK